MGSLGAESFDSLSAFTAGLSDQCVSIQISVSSTVVSVYQFGNVGTDNKGQREEWWKLWLPSGVTPPTPSLYFAIKWFDNASETVPVIDLTPDNTKKPFGMVPAHLNQFFIRVPRNKPFGYFRWSGADEVILRGCRYMPPLPPPGV
jgi:hypothetical protein